MGEFVAAMRIALKLNWKPMQILLVCAFTAVLPAQQRGDIAIEQQVWRDQPLRHLFVRGVMNGDTRFQLMFPAPELWRGRAIQFLDGGLGGNDASGSRFGAHEYALRQGAFYVESNQGHQGQSFYKENDTPQELAFQANYAVMQYARIRAVELYGKQPAFTYVLGGSGGGMRSIELMERFPDIYQGAVPLVAPSDFQLGAYQFSLYEAYREPITAARKELDDAVRPGSDKTLLEAAQSPETKDALRRLLSASYPVRSLWLVQQSPVALMVMDYLKYKALPSYFDDYWMTPGLHDDPAGLFGKVRSGLRGRVSSVNVERRRIGIELESDAGDLYGFTIRFLSGKLGGEWRRVLNGNKREVTLGFVGPGIEGVSAGDAVELDNRDLLAWKALHRHIVLPGEPVMRQFVGADGKPLHRQIEKEKLALLRQPERTIGKFQGKMLFVYGTDDPLIWPGLGLHYQRMMRQQQGARSASHSRIYFIEHGPHGMVVPGGEARQVGNFVPFFKALDQLIPWVEQGTAPAPSTKFTVDALSQIQLPADSSSRGGYQPVVQLRSGQSGVRKVSTQAGQVVEFTVSAEDPDNDLALVEFDYNGDGKYDDSAKVSGRRATANFKHTYSQTGVFFPTVRVTDSTALPGIPVTGIQNLATLRVVVE